LDEQQLVADLKNCWNGVQAVKPERRWGQKSEDTSRDLGVVSM
jgi:hypothetical protein